MITGAILFGILFAPIRGMMAAATFPRTTVISLPRHTSRRKQIIEELSSKKVTFSWFDAVDGLKLTQTELCTKASPLARWFMTPGMIGCFLSHRQCWENCLASGQPLLVFEDDVILAPNFRAVVMAAMSQLSSVGTDRVVDRNDDCDMDTGRGKESELRTKFEWDVLLLGALGCVHPGKKFGLNLIASLVGGKWRRTHHVTNFTLPQSSDCIANKTMNADPPFIHVPMCPYGMHAYIISPRGAAKLLKRCPRASFHVDVVAWGLKELDMMAVHPLVAWQINADTTIGGLVNIWKKVLRLPTFVADEYTGFEMGWAFCAPLLRVGGPFFGGKLLLTNGSSLVIMLAGIIAGLRTKSKWILGITFTYVILVAATVRLLASEWNS